MNPEVSQKKTEFEMFVATNYGITPSIQPIEISESLHEMYRIRKHYLIFTDAGKPVYTRYGDENSLAPFFATLSAVVPKIQNYFWDHTHDASKNNNQLHVISSKQFKCHMLRKGSLIYMCLINLHLRSGNGGDDEFFIDDENNQPITLASDKNHILT